MEPSEVAKHLSDGALADRLRRVVANDRLWSKAERHAFMLEAATRLERVAPCSHRRYGDTSRCAEMSCHNYAGKHI